MQRGLVLLAALMLASPARANESPGVDRARSSTERLLALAGEPSAKNLLAARQYYLSLPEEIGRQPHVQYAYLLALIQHRRFQEANELVNEMVDAQTRDLAVWRASVWLKLSIGEGRAAISDLERLARRPAGWHDLPNGELAELLGAACGFLSGPYSRYVRAADAQSLADRLRAGLSDDGRILFDRAQKEVHEHYGQLRTEYDQRAQKELASRADELDAAKKSVDRAAHELGDKKQALKDKRDRYASDAKQELSDVDEQLKAIEKKRQPLLKQIATLEAEQLALVSQLLPEPAGPSPRGNSAAQRAVTQAILMHNKPIRQLLGHVVAKLTPLAADATALTQRETELLLRRAATQAKYEAEFGKIEHQARSLDKDGKRIAYKAKRIKARPVAAGPRLSVQAPQLTRFSTYVPFPFDRERQRLLEHEK